MENPPVIDGLHIKRWCSSEGHLFHGSAELSSKSWKFIVGVSSVVSDGGGAQEMVNSGG